MSINNKMYLESRIAEITSLLVILRENINSCRDDKFLKETTHELLLLKERLIYVKRSVPIIGIKKPYYKQKNHDNYIEETVESIQITENLNKKILEGRREGLNKLIIEGRIKENSNLKHHLILLKELYDYLIEQLKIQFHYKLLEMYHFKY